MAAQPHAIVLGLGIAGSSIAATLAQKGLRVTAIEQFPPLHERGSSHGDTRIYRRVPHEGPSYVNLAARSWEGWHAWGKLAHEDLLIPCGGVDAGPAQSRMVTAAEKLCKEYRQRFDVFDGASFNRRFPHFRVPSGWNVVYQPSSGIVRPDATRAFLHAMARTAHATLLHDSRVTGWEASAQGVAVSIPGARVTGDVLIIAAGSWLPQLVPRLPLPLTAERRVMAWYRPTISDNLTGGRFPIFVFDADGGWYGMPTPDGLVKLGHDKHLGQRINPDQPPIAPDDADRRRLAPCIRTYFQGFVEAPVAMKPCIYTLAQDHHFLIDRHPDHSQVLLFSCCSGHGFKYAPEYGAIAADLVTGKPRPDLAPFSFRRAGPGVTRFGA
jgi:sarcosine oxidase